MAFILSMAIFFVAIDRFLKSMALFYGNNLSLTDNIFKFGLAKNYNIAFSFPISGTTLNIVIALIILLLVLILINFFKKQDVKNTSLILFLIAGAASNLYDRLKYGYVIDYFDLKYFTVFNLADAMITGGVLVIILINLRHKKYGF